MGAGRGEGIVQYKCWMLVVGSNVFSGVTAILHILSDRQFPGM